jgi:hypothetical protein
MTVDACHILVFVLGSVFRFFRRPSGLNPADRKATRFLVVFCDWPLFNGSQTRH